MASRSWKSLDDGSRAVLLESLRETPTDSSVDARKSAHNRNLYALHLELDRQCQGLLRTYDRSARSISRDIGMQQSQLQNRSQELKREIQRSAVRRQRTHFFFTQLDSAHNQKEMTRVEPSRWKQKEPLRDIDVIRAIGAFALTKTMRIRAKKQQAEDEEENDKPKSSSKTV